MGPTCIQNIRPGAVMTVLKAPSMVVFSRVKTDGLLNTSYADIFDLGA